MYSSFVVHFALWTNVNVMLTQLKLVRKKKSSTKFVSFEMHVSMCSIWKRTAGPLYRTLQHMPYEMTGSHSEFKFTDILH